MTIDNWDKMQLTGRQKKSLGNILQLGEVVAQEMLTDRLSIKRAHVDMMRQQWLTIGVLLDQLEESAF